MERFIKLIIIILGITLFGGLVYATITTASIRKSSKLPWQGTKNGYFNAAHNVGSNYLPESRFACVSGTCNSTISNNGVVKDAITGLYWQSGNSSTTYTWIQSSSYCDNLTLGTYADWRVPNIKELVSLADFSKPGGTAAMINTTYFSDESTWSSTSYVADSSTYAWAGPGGAGYGWKGASSYVRCVR